MPRPYRLGARKASTEETRARVVAAAHELLATSASPVGFSIDDVARTADVARMTVYYQFGSKAGLLEAVFDDLAAKGGMHELASVFQKSDPLEGLDEFVGVFCRFWASDPMIFRRLRALATLDPDLERALSSRDQWARQGLRVLLGRLAAEHSRPAPDNIELAAVLFTLISFQTFDTLQSQMGAGPEEIAAVIRRLARCALEGIQRS
ncbi:MAG TPA: TetR/AcrR family transcriptional regulator [Chloroflexota bacterium]